MTMRCISQYANVVRMPDGTLEPSPLRPVVRCTREEGHPLGDDEMHQNLAPGHRTRWPEEASVIGKVKDRLTVDQLNITDGSVPCTVDYLCAAYWHVLDCAVGLKKRLPRAIL